MRRTSASGNSFKRTWQFPNSGRGAVFAFLTLAAAGCGPPPPTDEQRGIEVVARSLTDDGGASATDGGASPVPLVVESKLATTGMTAWSQFGSSLAVDGDVMVSSAPAAMMDDDLNAGAAYVFYRDATTNQWSERKKLVPLDTVGFFTFGQALALNGDTIAVTVPSGTFNGVVQGAGIYLFGRDQGGPDQWGVMIRITDPIANEGVFASTVALAGDLLFVGAVSASAEGMVMIFERDRGGPNMWGKIATILESDLGSAKGTDEAFGAAVAVDGDNLLIGAPPDRNTDEEGDNFWSNNNGAAYLFARDPINRDQWSFVTRLASSAAAGEYDNFGLHVALAGDTAIVAAQDGVGVNGTAAGAVYVFRQDEGVPNSWHQTAKLSASDGQRADDFGSAIAFTGDTLLIGASEKHVGFNLSQGGAYVFRRSSAASDTWEEAAILTASDGQEGDKLGSAVALAGQTNMVGAPRREGDVSEVGVHYFGAVYLYELQEPPPPPELLCHPQFSPTDTLSDASVIVSASGIWLGTSRGTLSAPLPVWINPVAAPSEPLFSQVTTAVGAYTNIGASCAKFAPRTRPFVLGLPVPEGADTAQLGVAALVPALSMLDGPSAGQIWVPIRGSYDSEHRLYLVTVAGLSEEGHTFVLVTDPAFAAPPATAPAARTTAARTPPVFEVHCVGLNAAVCGPAQEIIAGQHLFQAAATFKQQRFGEPYLHQVTQITVATDLAQPSISITTQPVYDGVTLRPSSDPICIRDGLPLGGGYSPDSQTITICLDAISGLPTLRLRDFIFHELFHAIQFGYPAVRDNPRDDWVIEGTAETAVRSSAHMHRAPDRALRVVDTTLVAPIGGDAVSRQLPYQAQDFWVHLFRCHNLGVSRDYPLGDLARFFSSGASTVSVADRMVNTLSFRPLGLEYWAWVKNQVFEKTDVNFDGKLTVPCSLETNLVGEIAGFQYPAADKIFGDFADPLQTDVVEITFTVATASVVVSAQGPSDLAYKVYLKGEATCTDADGVPDGQRTFVSLPAGAVVQVVLVNKKYLSTAAALPLYEVNVTEGG